MNESDLVNKLFEEISQTMKSKFKGWEKDIPHEGEKGGIRERRVSELLRTYLPQCFGIGSGHIIDKQGNISGQVDIVIYNSLDGIHLPIDENYSLFPCECVHAAIEVKSTLTASSGSEQRGTILECIETATKIKSLKKGENNGSNDIPTFIFAYKSNWQSEYKKVMDWFQKLSVGKCLPEMVFVLDPGYLICNYWKEPVYTHLFEKAPLLKFYEELFTRIQEVKISNPSLWNEYIKWGTKDVIAKVFEYKKRE